MHGKLDFLMDTCAITQGEPLRCGTLRAIVDQQTRRERRQRARAGRWQLHRTETTVNETTRTYRRKARQAYSKLKPNHEEVVEITGRESYVKSSHTTKTRRGVTPRDTL